MFRKFVLALGATAVVGSAALIPTSASAHHHGHRWFGWGGPALILAAPSCYTVKQNVLTPIGWQVRYVQVCD